MRLGIDPTVDVVFKRLFGTEENAALLIHFLNAVLDGPGDRRIVSVEFLTPIRDRDTEDDKLVVVDLRVRDQTGRQIIVEMQVVVHKAFKERLLYYWAKDYVQQLGTGKDYGELTPTILVCVVVGNLFRESPDYRHRFRLVSDRPGMVFSDHLEIHTLELDKFNQPLEQLAGSLEQWSWFLKHAGEIDPRQVPESLREEEIHRAVEVLSMISQSERDRVEYEVREKRRRDLINRDKLIEEHGVEIGIEIGEEKGVLMGQIQLLQKLLGGPVTPIEVLRQLTVNQLKADLDACQTRLQQRKGAT